MAGHAGICSRPYSHDREMIFKKIVQFKLCHDGCSPTNRDLMELTGVKSTSHMSWILERLEEDGYIRLLPGKARGIVVIGGHWNFDP